MTLIEQLKANILEITGQHPEAVNLTPETTIVELGLDSLDMVELAFFSEETHGILVDDAKWDEAKTVGDLLKLIETALAP